LLLEAVRQVASTFLTVGRAVAVKGVIGDVGEVIEAENHLRGRFPRHRHRSEACVRLPDPDRRSVARPAKVA
jgi:hypothetical protein